MAELQSNITFFTSEAEFPLQCDNSQLNSALSFLLLTYGHQTADPASFHSAAAAAVGSFLSAILMDVEHASNKKKKRRFLLSLECIQT